MYKTILALIICSLMVACTGNQQESRQPVTGTGETEQAEQESGDDGLMLNNGQKWNSDSITINNVLSMKQHVEGFNNRKDHSLEAYRMIANDLQEDLDKMIRECKMKGPDHEALHQWLHPIMKQVKQLKQSNNEGEASKSLNDVSSQLNLFTDFFE